MFSEGLSSSLFLFTEDAGHLFVDKTTGVFGVVPAVHEIFAEKHHSLGSPRHWADAFGHAPLAHHLPCEFGVALEVVGGTSGKVAVR